MTLSHKKSRYRDETKERIGDSSKTQLSTNYIIRAGYPDIRLNGYFSINQYSNHNHYFLPANFVEFGTQLSVSASTKNRLQRCWRPFGMLGLAINDKEEIGTNLSLGISGALRGEDSLSLLLDYSKGVDSLSSAYYGIHLEYRF